ncbi:hypothetical protein D3C75_461980 [compost metagenome]
MSNLYPIDPLPLLVLRKVLRWNEREPMLKICVRSLNKAGYITIGDGLSASHEQLEGVLVRPGRIHLIKDLLERLVKNPDKVIDLELYDRQVREAIVQKARLE